MRSFDYYCKYQRNFMKKIILSFVTLAVIFSFHISLFSQQPTQNWMLLNYENDSVPGVSEKKAYSLLANKKPKKVVVAVIDSGVDILHEDLNDVIWINEDEIANNGIDDDKNGYVDDIYGWNFIGGKDGKHVNQDSYEITRLYGSLEKKYGNKTAKEIGSNERKEFDYYQKIKKEWETKMNEYLSGKAGVETLLKSIKETESLLKEKFQITDITEETLEKIDQSDETLNKAIVSIQVLMMMTGSKDYYQLISILKNEMDYYQSSLDYGYNLSFDPRHIVGDNYSNSAEKNYGNSDVKGPDPSHGTHVAGIIAAERGNGIGMDGISNATSIMVLRAVPNGDERDKDVANAIIYAADNGAKIINMSFGKKYYSDKQAVDNAIKYAESKDVLLIHAAGNDAENIDVVQFYPTRKFLKGSAKNWLEVGAMNWEKSPNAAGSFSNYGKKNVDLFAPGVDIYSTFPNQKYEFQQGTSMAAPVVAGVAAVLRSHFPELSASEIKKALLSSVRQFKGMKTNLPGSDKLVNFSDLSKTGGVVELSKAVEYCLKLTQGKK